ncbi:MAG: hypothetical protein OXF02_05325 [Simkaniaceae bacterium]|nr:hypothetical protein [Simkaniaceae bacterium]
MMGRVIFGGVIGGIVAFAWTCVAWNWLPWQDKVIGEPENRDLVSWIVRENVKGDGVYLIPRENVARNELYSYLRYRNVREPVVVHEGETAHRQPLIYLQVRHKGVDVRSPYPYLLSFLTQFVGAFLISLLLVRVALQSGYGKRLFFVTATGLIVGILGYAPNWIWFGGDGRFLLMSVVNSVVMWFLAGLFIAGIARPKTG